MQLILRTDPFNQYCIDCKQNLADHANLTFGTFICESCALSHQTFVGFFLSENIKAIKEDTHWEEEDVRRYINGKGGNKAFLDFLTQFKLESASLQDKYKSYPAQYYMHRLDCEIKGVDFTDMSYPYGDIRDKVN